MNQNKLLNDVEKKTGVTKNQIFDLVNSLQGANLQDEKTVRRMINQISHIANKPISKEKEDRLVKAIINKNVPNLAVIAELLSSK
ncbi:MAG TPA: stage VI sporulation protein F [Bacillales bacterium]